MDRRLVSVNPFHAKHVREPVEPKNWMSLSTNVSQPEKYHSNKTRIKTDRFRMQILRMPQRRADCAPLDTLGARRKTRRVHIARRAGCAPEDTPVARRKTRCLRAGRRAGCAPEDAPVARRKTRRWRAEKRAGCAPEDAPLARRKTRQERAARRAGCTPRARAGPPVLFRGGGRSLEVVGRRGRRVTDGAASPGRLGRGASPSPLAATGNSTQHLSQSRGALKLPRYYASCSLASVNTRDVSGVRRRQKEERQPNTTRV